MKKKIILGDISVIKEKGADYLLDNYFWPVSDNEFKDFIRYTHDEYLKIVKSYCNYYEIKCDKIVEDNALKWSLQRGNRNGRTAWQYIIQLAAEKNLKLIF